MDTEYWCHQCNQVIVPLFADEMCCPHCNQGFIEQIDSPGQVPMTVPAVDPRILPLLSAAAARIRRGGPNPSEDQHPGSRVVISGRVPVRDLLQLMANTFAGIQLSEENIGIGGGERVVVVDPTGVPLMMLGGGGGAGGGGGMLGDYFVGQGLESLIQRLMENDPNRYGTPPAASTAVDALPKARITERHLQFDYSSECAVCKEEYSVGEETLELPCKHLYHPECILPWLKMHSSCPVCRFQMPTDENTNANAASASSSREAEGSQTSASRVAGENESEGRNSNAGGNGNSGNGNGQGWVQRLMNQFLSSIGGGQGRNADSRDEQQQSRSSDQDQQ
eukprot:TRINITY_DN38073_c0_g1_i1.p1 TRINITY_DN38073_c0_g1~~TRINITY_DN38073_c0_g1_i1.p1  ORF type:complete len:336 (+),score=16.07 TRINITY_DN38073_c0_g1_i1:240-1247(+)